jgi:hypothetical protein
MALQHMVQELYMTSDAAKPGVGEHTVQERLCRLLMPWSKSLSDNFREFSVAHHDSCFLSIPVETARDVVLLGP